MEKSELLHNTHIRRSPREWFKHGVNSKHPLCQDSLAKLHTPSILMTSGYKVSLWKHRDPGPIPHPSVQPERAVKRPWQGRRKQRVKVREMGKERRQWMGVREIKRAKKKSEPKRQSERERGGEWRRSEALVGWSWSGARVRVLSMKTGRAVCRSQASDSTLPEKSFFLPPKICTLIFYPPPLLLPPSPHPSPAPFYRLTASLRLSNTFKQARWAQWNTPYCLQPAKSV